MLSPHADDAALSLAASISQGLLPRPITVITVFDHSTFAGRGRRGVLEAVTKRRAAEDGRFCTAVGATLVRLGMSDACVRYPTLPISQLFERDGDAATRRELRIRLDAVASDNTEALLCAPLGIGGHVDHRLVASAARSHAWTRKCFYADQPYALKATVAPPDEAVVVRCTAQTAETKRAAARMYPSQPAAADLVALLSQASVELPVEWFIR